MSIGKDGSQRPVPTLTEVVQLPAEAAGAGRNPTNPVVTPTLRKMSIDDSKKVGNDAARNRLATVLPVPTLPPVLAPGHLPVASSPIAMPSPMFAQAPATAQAVEVAPVVAPAAVVAPTAEPAPFVSSPPVTAVAPVVAPAPVVALPPIVAPAPVVPPAPAEPDAMVDAAPAQTAVASTTAPEAPAAPARLQPGSVEEARLVERVLADVQQRIDLLLEHRLRQALAPAFERIAQSLLVETREALSHDLREVLGASVARELERLRHRTPSTDE